MAYYCGVIVQSVKLTFAEKNPPTFLNARNFSMHTGKTSASLWTFCLVHLKEYFMEYRFFFFFFSANAILGSLNSKTNQTKIKSKQNKNCGWSVHISIFLYKWVFPVSKLQCGPLHVCLLSILTNLNMHSNYLISIQTMHSFKLILPGLNGEKGSVDPLWPSFTVSANSAVSLSNCLHLWPVWVVW